MVIVTSFKKATKAFIPKCSHHPTLQHMNLTNGRFCLNVSRPVASVYCDTSLDSMTGRLVKRRLTHTNKEVYECGTSSQCRQWEHILKTSCQQWNHTSHHYHDPSEAHPQSTGMGMVAFHDLLSTDLHCQTENFIWLAKKSCKQMSPSNQHMFII